MLQYKDFAVADALSTFLSKHEGEIDRRRNLLFEHFKGEKYGLFNQDPFSLYSGSLVDFYTGQFLAINKDLVECLTEEAGKVGETPFGVNISWFLPNLDKAMEIGIMHANKIDDESGGELAKKFIKHYFEFINNYAEQCSCLINHHNPNEHSFNERFLITFATKLKENLPCALSQRNIVDFLRSEVSTNEKSQERASIYLNYEF
ncbi:hypothetical protein HYT26_00605 [Candidatus Pacearchaeota archaeon]|nr:hypothetical protein [Candidatus Pacearchaeota archaeon]